MQELYPLFILATIWTIFAVVQDLKTREVSNWLNFSLIAFALAYRVFYAISFQDFNFIYFGILGFLTFFSLAHLLYYTQAFAGGDAKLLMGYGVILPFNSYLSLLTLTLSFTLLLFSIGAVYSLIFSIKISIKNKKIFKKQWPIFLKKYGFLITISNIFFFILIFIIYGFLNLSVLSLFFPLTFLFIVFPILFIYIKTLDRCMIVLTPANKLTEGDWIEKPIKLSKNKTIQKTVHGLSFEDIRNLKKYNVPVPIKEGIPFTPAFLISLIIMVYAFLISEQGVSLWLSFLF